MTEQIENTEETPQEPQEATVEPQDAPEQEESKKGNGEAAKWRVKYREAEQQITALQARVDDMQAAEVSRLATGPGALHDGQDLLLTTKLADLLDEDGNVDPEKVTEQVTALAERKPHLAKPAFEGGVGVGEKGATPSTSWADVIAG